MSALLLCAFLDERAAVVVVDAKEKESKDEKNDEKTRQAAVRDLNFWSSPIGSLAIKGDIMLLMTHAFIFRFC